MARLSRRLGVALTAGPSSRSDQAQTTKILVFQAPRSISTHLGYPILPWHPHVCLFLVPNEFPHTIVQGSITFLRQLQHYYSLSL